MPRETVSKAFLKPGLIIALASPWLVCPRKKLNLLSWFLPNDVLVTTQPMSLVLFTCQSMDCNVSCPTLRLLHFNREAPLTPRSKNLQALLDGLSLESILTLWGIEVSS